MHEPRRFVPRVDFLTSPGYLDGSPGARERAGLPRDTGPWRVVTSKALFGFADDTRELTLLGVLDGLAAEDVLGEMGSRPRVAARLERLSPPTERELAILREEVDPARSIIGKAARS